MKILIADDNPLNRLFIQRSLGKEHQIEQAANGMEAYQKATHATYDLILMDLSMPVLDGIQAILKIRDWEKSSRIFTPILVFSTMVDSVEKQKCLVSGANRYIQKPIHPVLLRKIINSYRKTG